jgi:hypothetical protein
MREQTSPLGFAHELANMLHHAPRQGQTQKQEQGKGSFAALRMTSLKASKINSKSKSHFKGKSKQSKINGKSRSFPSASLRAGSGQAHSAST